MPPIYLDDIFSGIFREMFTGREVAKYFLNHFRNQIAVYHSITTPTHNPLLLLTKI